MNYREALQIGSKFLRSNKIKNPTLDSELILSKVLNKTREQIIINDNHFINHKQINKFNYFLSRRKKNEPIAYILGFKYFWKYKFR